MSHRQIQQQLAQIRDVEKRISEINRSQMASRNSLKTIGDPQSVYKTLRGKWNELHSQKIRALKDQCEKFSALSNGLIRAEVKGSLDIDSLKQHFKTAFASLNIKDQKVDELCRCVIDAEDPIKLWNDVLSELEQLTVHDHSSAAEPLPTTAILDGCGFVTTERKRLALGLTSTRWLDLSVSDLDFSPVFQYCTNKDTSEFIAFADASAGQQATALLTVLLNQPGTPLIIDQPEDDVDSKLSPEIVQQIWKAKSRRQLIFASHNANFVVNGDAELVICCDYVRAGDQTGGQIKAMGAIDNLVIKDEITAVTEGGKAAFKLRKEKYGF